MDDMKRSDGPTKEFCCEYDHDGATWCLNIHAYDIEDAQGRVKKLGYLRLLGELHGTYPVELGWWVKMKCWLMNSNALKAIAWLLLWVCVAAFSQWIGYKLK